MFLLFSIFMLPSAKQTPDVCPIHKNKKIFHRSSQNSLEECDSEREIENYRKMKSFDVPGNEQSCCHARKIKNLS